MIFMITLFILLIIIGVIALVLCTGFAVLLDPIIAILCIVGIYKLIKYIYEKIK